MKPVIIINNFGHVQLILWSRPTDTASMNKHISSHNTYKIHIKSN